MSASQPPTFRQIAALLDFDEVEVRRAMRTLSCGARTRKGQACKRTDLALNGRCRFHGGASTGPKTTTGKARARQNLKLRWTRKSGDEA